VIEFELPIDHPDSTDNPGSTGDFDSTLDAAIEEPLAGLGTSIATYRDDYAAYYEGCKHDDSPPMRDANAVVYLAPGVGMFAIAKDKAAARISAEFNLNAINVMRETSAVSTDRGLPEQEAFDIEYWSLEKENLLRMPPPRSLARRVAMVTGGPVKH